MYLCVWFNTVYTICEMLVQHAVHFFGFHQQQMHISVHSGLRKQFTKWQVFFNFMLIKGPLAMSPVDWKW